MEQLCYLDMILNEFQLKSERKMIELHFSSISWATVGCSIPFLTQMYLNYWKIKVDQNQLQDFVSHPQINFYDCCANSKKTKQFTVVTLFSVQKIKLLPHCKYIQCNSYSFYVCPIFQCNPTVRFTSNYCSKYSGKM